MGKVLLIGGSPMIGKSTVARKISAMYEWSHLSTDDIGEMLQTVVDINPMKDMPYLDYYENTEVEVQIEDMLQYHRHIEKAILKMINIHSQWGQSMVMEGYAIYPNIVTNKNTEAIWLIATEELIRNRLDKSKAFSSASVKAKENYLKRSLWHNNFVEEQCRLHNRKQLKIYGNEMVDEIVKGIIEKVGL